MLQTFPKKLLKILIRIFIPLFIFLSFAFFLHASIEQTSIQTLKEEQLTLENAILHATTHFYATTGFYPQNFSEIQENYHITYDNEHFIVEYIPNGTNQFPTIQILVRDSQFNRIKTTGDKL